MDASVKRYQELLRLIEAKYEFGKVASVEPLQAQQSLLSARNSLLDLQDRQNVARQTLRDLLNIRPGENPVDVYKRQAIGIVFGFMPARNASRLNPIDALSRE